MIDTQKKIIHVVKDYTVSKQTFGLFLDSQTDMLVTFPQPNPADLHQYYQSSKYISHTDAKASFVDRIYQFVKKIAIGQKITLINSLHPNKGNMLDIGAELAILHLQPYKMVGLQPPSNPMWPLQLLPKKKVFQ